MPHAESSSREGQDLIIRPATPADALIGAALIYMSMRGLAEQLLGSDDAQEARRVLSKLFKRRGNRFSHQFAEMAEWRGEVAGMVLGYDGRILRRLELPTAAQLVITLGLPRFLRFVRNALPLRGLKEAEPDEYFINTVAVQHDLQGTGIGTAMLDHIEGRARATGFRACSLSVEVGNADARRLYERRGFCLMETSELRRTSPAAGPSGVYRMVKVL